jgi:hypothetical protein
MIPKDLSPFSVEQLRGFATLVSEQIAALKAARAEGAFSVEQAANFETLADDHVRIHEAIQAAADAESGEEAVEEAVAEETPAEGDEDEAEGEEGETPADADADAEAVVEEAVASAAMGGGAKPRITVNEERLDPESMRKFVRGLANGNGSVRSEERQSFTTLRRETNHIVRKGQDATEAIAEAIGSRAAGTDKTAAGCFCGPDDAVTAIKQCGETTRPFSDTLPTLTASGDIRYIRQISLEDALTGVTEWTCADQDLVDPENIATWKPCFELECEEEQTSAMYAVPACASFTTQQLIGNPVLVDNLQHVMEVAYNKTAELLVYNRVRALASQYTFGYATAGYGASAQLLAAVGWALEAIRVNLRESDPNYTLALPTGLIERVLTDGVIRGTDDYRTRDDLFDRLTTLGVSNIVELTDEVTGVPAPLAHAALNPPGDAAIAAPAHPVEQQILLYRPEDFVLGVAPELDLGVTRSPELARQNKLQWFVESFEFVEKVGCAPAIDLVVPFCASGIRPAFGEGEDCVVVE